MQHPWDTKASLLCANLRFAAAVLLRNTLGLRSNPYYSQPVELLRLPGKPNSNDPTLVVSVLQPWFVKTNGSIYHLIHQLTTQVVVHAFLSQCAGLYQVNKPNWSVAATTSRQFNLLDKLEYAVERRDELTRVAGREALGELLLNKVNSRFDRLETQNRLQFEYIQETKGLEHQERLLTADERAKQELSRQTIEELRASRKLMEERETARLEAEAQAELRKLKRQNATPAPPRDILSIEARDHLFNKVVIDKTFESYRSRLAFAVLSVSGMRANEARTLTVRQVKNLITNGRCQLHLLKGGSKNHTVIISSEDRTWLQSFLDDFASITRHKNLDSYAFTSVEGDLLQPNSWLRNLNEQLAVLSDAKELNITTHSFRRTRITNLCKKGIPMDTIKDLMGHASTVTTRIYSSHIPSEASTVALLDAADRRETKEDISYEQIDAATLEGRKGPGRPRRARNKIAKLKSPRTTPKT